VGQFPQGWVAGLAAVGYLLWDAFKSIALERGLMRRFGTRLIIMIFIPV